MITLATIARDLVAVAISLVLIGAAVYGIVVLVRDIRIRRKK